MKDENVSIQKEEKVVDQLVTIGPNVIGGEHHFVYKSGTEVICTKCPLGYPITPGTEVKNGHLYIHGELVV